MMKKTHVAISLAITIPIVKYLNIPYVNLIAVLGATAPDWDIIIPGIKHRTITHSLLISIISTALISSFNFSIGFIWFISYLSHLLSDSFTRMGVPLLYPFKKENYGFKLIRTGQSEDMFVCLLAIFIISLEIF